MDDVTISKEDVLLMSETDDDWTPAALENFKEAKRQLLLKEKSCLEEKLTYAPCTVNNIRILAHVDNGCTTLIVGERFCKENNIEITPKNNVGISLGDATHTGTITGTADIILEWMKPGERSANTFTLTAYVMKTPSHPTLTIGNPFFAKLGISIGGIPVAFPKSDKTTEEEDDDEEEGILKREDELPKDVKDRIISGIQKSLAENQNVQGFCNHPLAEIALETIDDYAVYTSPYPIADKFKPKVQEKIKQLLEMGVISKVPPGANYNNPLTVTLKKDAEGRFNPNDITIRLCLDTRKLNAKLKNLNYRIPIISDIFRRLRGAQILSLIDVADAYYNIRIREQDVEKLAFRWERDTFVFNRAPFGLKTMVSKFQSFMETILDSVMQTILVYLDDIIVHTHTTGKDQEDLVQLHIDQLNAVIQLLTAHNIRLKIEKCRFGFSRIRILGHIISGESRGLDPEKISVLEKYPKPTCGKQIMAFLGFSNYLRDYIPLYSELLAPLECLRNASIINEKNWSEECDDSFSSVKNILINAPVLKFPVDGIMYEIMTDASSTGVGACLFQEVEGKKNYIQFAAKSLTEGQSNYSATRRELLAVIFSLKKFHEYIYGNRFVIHTDHKALQFMLTQEHLNPMLAEWVEVILDYDFEVRHMPGILNTLADSLSRAYPKHMRQRRDVQVYDSKAKLVLSKMSITELVKKPNTELIKLVQERLLKTLPPLETQEGLIVDVHDEGHFGSESVYQRLWQKGYYWPTMKQDCVQQCATCKDCLAWNVGRRQWHPIRHISAIYPLQHISLDNFSMPQSDQYHTHCLVVKDICTGFIWLSPLKGESSQDIATAIIQFVGIFGFPDIVQSDNGPGFVSEVMRQVYEKMGSKKRDIAPLNPRANGSAEKAVDVAKTTILKMSKGKLSTWYLCVPMAQLAINVRIASRHGHSPFSLLFGHSADIPNEYYDMNVEKKHLSPDDIIEKNKQMMEVVFPALHKKLESKLQRQAEKINEKRQTVEETLKEGTPVMIMDTQRSKSEPRYVGPYTVVERKGNSYSLLDTTNTVLPRIVPIEQLKLIKTKRSDTAKGKDEEIQNYEVSQIVDHKVVNGADTYRVRWKHYDESDDTWQSEADFDDIDPITRYWNIIYEKPPKGKTDLSRYTREKKVIDEMQKSNHNEA